ncbi:hypothetical protein ANCCEY_14726 [Ancylostoma ceylanicum]|uniref:Uncharacterized protein n=1 Tax=Ancylostoma ceylanicum TaxID=53326 RepID=A0A0D6L940_9BILA|nr:hypothetical protein ANCCEY_14726 [Ancylostoma ceylanicum]
MHGLEDGDHVTFSEVKGMTQLNGCSPIKVTVKKPHVFNIGDAAKNLSPYEEGGRVKQVKVPTTVSHKALADSLAEPEFVYWDFAKFDYPSQLHLLWNALYKFEAKHGRHPNPRSDSDVQLLKAELPSGAEVDEKLLKRFSYQASGNLVTIASVVGGIAAQEAMKASKKSTVAGRAVKVFNKDVRIQALSERVGADTEHIFNDDFFAELDGVANALDNIDARKED